MYLKPLSPEGWALALVWGVALLGAAYHWRNYRPKWGVNHWIGFFALLIATPLFAVWGIEFPKANANVLFGDVRALLLPFIAVPWMLAAGYLGVMPAMALGFVAEAITGFFGTRLPFQPLIGASLGFVVGWAFWQPYRGRLYHWLRQPVVAASFVSVLYALLFYFAALFSGRQPFLNRLDFAVANLRAFTALETAELLIAAVIGQAIVWLRIGKWGYRGALQPSPSERSLVRRFSLLMAMLVALLTVGVLVGNWVLAQRSARGLLVGRLRSMADIASQSLPFFTENGQTIIRELASDSSILNEKPADLTTTLAEKATGSAFFNTLVLVTPDCEEVAASRLHPPDVRILDVAECKLLVLPLMGGVPVVRLAHNGRVDFAAPVKDPDGKTAEVLVGLADIQHNPYTKPLTDSLREIEAKQGGGAVILSRTGGLLFATGDEFGWLTSENVREGASVLADSTGKRYVTYAERAVGSSWLVVVLSPESNLHAIALNNALPLSLIVLLLAIAGLGGARSLLGVITRSLLELTQAADRIAMGHLDEPLQMDAVDEVGRLGRAFERMRVKLRQRIGELNRLLATSQQVAVSLKVDKAAEAVLTAALSTGASAARVVLSQEAIPDEMAEDYPASMGIGPRHDRFAPLDGVLLEIAAEEGVFQSTRPHAALRSHFKGELPAAFSALLSVAMYYEQRFLGVLYLVYERPHRFEEDEIRYVSALALQMAMAAYAARLYATAEVRRQRLRAILDATPEPVLVTDKHGRLILANTAAFTHLPLTPSLVGQPIETILRGTQLLSLFKSDKTPPYSEEVTVDNRVYFATVASVNSGGREIGRVCLLRDVTHFKELDALKSEFVATVSHDLRAPLTLMRGYLTMLDMVGELNERQRRYISHIQQSVENMTRLVNNLLDLGRIEAGVGLQVQMVPLLDLLKEIKQRWEPQAARKQISLSLNLAAKTPPLIEADPALLERAISNLVENAIKYTPEGGKVMLFAYPRGEDKVVIGVRDTGIGISQVDQPRLFEKFFRVVRKGQPKEQGTGLGLAIVKSIVENHNGRIWVESQIGKGSTFYIELPLRQPREEKPEPLAA